MINSIKLPNEKYAVAAEYTDQVLEEYQNPLIEALPPVLSKQHIVEQIGNYPHISDKERELEAHYRMHLVQRVFQYFQPLPFHISLEQTLSRIIRQSYIGRDPLSPEYAISFHQGWNEIMSGRSQIHYVQNATAFSMSLIGISGMGKSTSIDRVLKLTPQVIVHSKYKGRELSLIQVTYLKIQTSFDGSLKSLCLDFMRQVDELIGTNYFEKYGKKSRLSTNTLLPLMGQIARSISLGIFVIDEVQHLVANRLGAERTLNYFVTLVNELGIPIVFISTPKGMNILQSEFRQARRSSGQGSYFLDRLKKDAEWDVFIGGLWRYQWTRNFIELDAELNSVLYEVSQGIIDIACKVFVMTQLRAISSGQEKISSTLIKRVANRQFKLLKPVIDGLREGKTSKLAMYEDVIIPDIVQFTNKEQEKLDLGMLMKRENNAQTKKLETLKDDSIFRLQFLGMPENEARKVVEQYLRKYPKDQDLNSIVKGAFQLAMGVNNQTPRINSSEDTTEDLRTIIDKGKPGGQSAYEAIKKAGYIRA